MIDEKIIGHLVSAPNRKFAKLYGIVVPPSLIETYAFHLNKILPYALKEDFIWAIWEKSIWEAVEKYEKANRSDLLPVSCGGSLTYFTCYTPENLEILDDCI